jgi:ABC-2 type transport system permease protein
VNTINSGGRASTRIIWAIAAKDISDAIRNKTTLSAVLSAALLILFFRFLPALESGDALPRLALYDAGNSALISALQESEELDLVTASSLEEMERYLGDKDLVVLGLALPPDVDDRLKREDALTLAASVVHWVSEEDASESARFFEQKLSALTGRDVRLELDEDRVFTRKDSRGHAFLTSAGMIIIILLVGASVAPNLMIEERQSRTMDALLLSPATEGQLVVAKAATGLFYCLSATVLIFFLNTALITQWTIALLGALSGSLLAVALGLLIGAVSESRQKMTVWTWLLLTPLIVPVFLLMATNLFPSTMITVLQWVPTVALSQLFRVSFSDQAAAANYIPELVLVGGFVIALLVTVAWIVRRRNQT